MIGHEKISDVEFGLSYMHFLPNIHLCLCMPKFRCLALLYLLNGMDLITSAMWEEYMINHGYSP